MSKISINSGEVKPSYTENENTRQILSKRYCGNCNKEYSFDNVIRKYPELYQTPIATIWKNPETKFYCSYCYLLMIIKSMKRDKKIN